MLQNIQNEQLVNQSQFDVAVEMDQVRAAHVLPLKHRRIEGLRKHSCHLALRNKRSATHAGLYAGRGKWHGCPTGLAGRQILRGKPTPRMSASSLPAGAMPAAIWAALVIQRELGA